MLLLSTVRALVAGRLVMRGKDVSETDRCGRLLRYGYLADGTVVNAELVRHGLARVIVHLSDVSKERRSGLLKRRLRWRSVGGDEVLHAV